MPHHMQYNVPECTALHRSPLPQGRSGPCAAALCVAAAPGRRHTGPAGRSGAQGRGTGAGAGAGAGQAQGGASSQARSTHYTGAILPTHSASANLHATAAQPSCIQPECIDCTCPARQRPYLGAPQQDGWQDAVLEQHERRAARALVAVCADGVGHIAVPPVCGGGARGIPQSTRRL